MPGILDPAILRPGRFDQKFSISLPDHNTREELLKYYYQDSKKGKTIPFDVHSIAKQTVGFTPADISNLVNLGLIQGFKHPHKLMNTESMQRGFEKMVTGITRKTLATKDSEKLLIAIRHAGMALIARNRKNSVDYSYMSIFPKDEIDGQISGVSISERIFENKSEILATIDFYLSARESEAEFFFENNGPHVGSSEYLDQAGKLAYLYVKMFKESQQMLSSLEESKMSQAFRYSVDREVKELLVQRKEIVRKEIVYNRKNIFNLASRLVEKETLTKENAESFLIIK